MAKEIVETPLMKQYIEMKAKHPDAILLFRVGDFYETFSDDALVASEILGITLTRRANGAAQYVELAGFPHHALDTYLPKLVRAGKRVAICEQLEDPKLTKKLVKRGITELVTPGVSINDNILDHRENNFLAGVHFGKGNKVGVAFLDISTGEFFFRHPEVREVIDPQLDTIGDMERLISKVAVGRISPREVVQLKVALSAIEPIKAVCEQSDEPVLQRIGEQLNCCTIIRDRIEHEINPDAPNLVNRGGIIRKGVNDELDELREISYSGKDYLLHVQQRESEKTGIPSLKIGYNNVFGYYIEVRNTHKDKVPSDWIRKQTLVSAERYITQELKEYEEKILGAEEKILSLETQLFNDLILALTEYIPAIQLDSNLIARLDCLLSFVKSAVENRYIRPEVNDSLVIDIKEGRHPVIEKQLPPGEPYISNSVELDNDKQQIMMITGPNMAGKSALLRQTALIVLMAQIGSFVPSEAAKIGIVDKIFTRVGASDNISLGESTFMVEMTEAADILNNLSERSLVLFDELGRGTSTYDGISIAWAIVEHIHEHPKARAKTLFATHYHELNEMERTYKRIVNYNVSVKEVDNKVIFLRKLVRGGSEHSFGIHVAKLAGMPQSIVKRANQILKQLESENRQNGIAKPTAEIASSRGGMQLSFFQLDDPVLSQVRDEILQVDINNLTPVEALNKLNEIRKIITGK